MVGEPVSCYEYEAGEGCLSLISSRISCNDNFIRSDICHSMRAEKRFFRRSLFPATAFAIALASPFASIQEIFAHHTSGISYIFQKMGEQTVGCFSVEMTATPPKPMWVDEKEISKKDKHKRLDRFTQN